MGDARAFTPDEIRAYLMGESPGLMGHRRRFRHLPSPPRCKLCLAPFAGVGGLLLKPAGFGRSAGNPAMCVKCEIELAKHGLPGIEIPVTMLFSDIRGSTAMGERMRPAEFHAFLDHFYRLASEAIFEHDGLVDKIVGDEVIGMFFGGISGPNHPASAVAAAVEIAERAANVHATPSGSIPAGTAVHTGEAFVGTTGPPGTINDFTALGDAVNATARLASAAGAGDVVVSLAAAKAAGTLDDSLERRTVEIRGRSESIEVVVLRPAEAPRLASS